MPESGARSSLNPPKGKMHELEKVRKGALCVCVCTRAQVCVYMCISECVCVCFNYSQEKDNWWHASGGLTEKEFV